jgi:hypothetical protein
LLSFHLTLVISALVGSQCPGLIGAVTNAAFQFFWSNPVATSSTRVAESKR